MAKIIPALILIFLGTPYARANYQSRIPELIKQLRAAEISSNPVYEETFNAGVKGIENAVEEEKLFCSGEAANKEGVVIPKDQRQLCFRQLKNHYLESIDAIFELKKKYLQVLHQRQLENLTGIQKKLRTDIEKSF
jgi:hypothetical protein